VTEDAAQPFASGNRPWGEFWNPIDQPVADTLVAPLQVIMLHVARNRSPQVPLTEQDDPVEALRLDREDEAMNLRNPASARVRALELLARTQGLFTDIKHVQIHRSPAEIEEELLQKLGALNLPLSS
jgi:hypothetical protein